MYGSTVFTTRASKRTSTRVEIILQRDASRLLRELSTAILAVARKILNLAARLWRDKGSTLTWLAQAPLIQFLENKGARKPYPIDWSEQELLFRELTPHLQRAALFKVNTGMRQKEVCPLRWEWEQRVPELDTPEIKRTVFVLPEWVTKNRKRVSLC
jgi:integrase